MDVRVHDMVVALFRYADEYQDGFAYLRDYDTHMQDWLEHQRLDAEQLKRYMLAGLFYYYRALNHLGENLRTTQVGWFDLQNPNTTKYLQFQTFNLVFGRPINTTKEYLALLQAGSIEQLGWIYNNLFAFVIEGLPDQLQQGS